jgi:3-deoxy-manno-octulosonate cytidylyltransferase (CMP-KDO synthetase)
MGVYAYTETALKMYLSYSVGKLETQEALEQLRFLENGIRIRCVEFNLEKDSFWELNNQSDIPKIENILKNKSIK